MKKTVLFLMISMCMILFPILASAQVGEGQHYAGIHLGAVKLTGGDEDLSAIRSWMGIKYGYYIKPIVGVELNVGSGFVIPRSSVGSGSNWYSDHVNGYEDSTKTYLMPIALNVRLNAVANSPLIPFLRFGLGAMRWTVRDVSNNNNSNSKFVPAGDKIDGYDWSTNFFAQAGAGFEIWFAGPVTLELSANYKALIGQDKDMFALDALGMFPGLEDKPTGCVDLRVALNVNFAGRFDKDGDGIFDNKDGCPDDPEDFDGFEDEDGCPDLDNDNDGIPDVDDNCPNDPEDIDGFEDEDGCPDLDNDADGILDVDDDCPNDPEDFDQFEDEDGCPDFDNDKDGILDVDDECPNDPEDIDGFEDQNGCPDPDNDKDGILDVNDGCPDDPETFNDYEDEDGCPDAVPEVIFTKESPIILEGVNFATNSADLTSGAKEVLMKVVRTLKDHMQMELLIKGHTDNVGADAYNMNLSDRRANSVRQFLINQGIAGSRLESLGFGETQPMDTNATKEGRAKNRRIEFFRTK